ncbi:MAG: hypothetical protein ACI9CE_000338 [Flavobacterium sp.]|jgi:hypothetical protein
MSDVEKTEAESDSFVDAMSVVLAITIAVIGVIYWITNQ